jgi:DNA-binding CsgD family transcriptional regulator
MEAKSMTLERTQVSQLQPDDVAVPAVDAVAQLYKLTVAERRVLSAVVASGGVRSVATALGISQATVKTHLQNIFGKTGARRQIDLVKLVIAGTMGDQGGAAAHDHWYVRTN